MSVVVVVVVVVVVKGGGVGMFSELVSVPWPRQLLKTRLWWWWRW